MKRFKIGKKFIGISDPCFVVAELSANHGGKISNAIKIIKHASQIGVDAVKLQTYTADSITLNSYKKDFLIPKKSPWSKEKNLWNLYEKGHTPWSWHEKLFTEAKKNNIEIFSSPFDEKSVDLLEQLGCVAYKIASPEINHIPLLIKVARTKKPVILSTGLSSLHDIKLAISVLKKNGCKNIILLKCTTDYPAELDETNLITLDDYKKRFNVIPGFSDHTKGKIAALSSVALGAKFLEKHFLLKGTKSLDDFFSMNHIEFGKMIKEIRDVEKVIGNVSYDIAKGAKVHFKGRRSIYISKDIQKGEILTKDNIQIVRPNYGLQPVHFNKILGKKINKSLKAGSRMKLSYIK